MKTKNYPDWVEKYRTKGRTIKEKDGKYYLYSEKCVYDPNYKYKHVTKNVYLGRIDKEKGFIEARKRHTVLPSNMTSRVYGPYALFDYVGKDILERLEKYFGKDNAEYIFTIASLRAAENTPYYCLEDTYEDSYFSCAFNNLSMSKASLSRFLDDLSSYRDQMIRFMKEDIDNDDVLIFDGTNLLCGGHDISYRGFGYLHHHNYSSQFNELYAYSAKNHKPVYYRLAEGSIPDKTAFKDIIKESGIREAVALIDKGFNGKESLEELIGRKNRYIMALRSDTVLPSYITDDISRDEADESFVVNGEAVSAYMVKRDDHQLCVYFNSTIAAVEEAGYIDQMNKGIKGYTREGYKEARNRFGIYVLKTNVTDFTLEKIYRYYKSRFEIEYMFDTIKNTLGYDKTYMHKVGTIEGWAFINHISIILTQRIYDLLLVNESRLSLHELFRKLRRVKVVRDITAVDGSYKLESLPKKTKLILETLGMDISSVS